MSDFPPLFGSPDTGLIVSPDSIHGPFHGLGGSTYLDSVYPAASLTIYVPVRLGRPLTVTQAFVLNGATVAGTITIGVYLPNGTKVVATAATTMAGASATQTIDFTDTDIGPGLYYLAFSCSSATASFMAHTPSQLNDLKLIGLAETATAFPDPATFASISNSYVPLFGLTTRSVV